MNKILLTIAAFVASLFLGYSIVKAQDASPSPSPTASPWPTPTPEVQNPEGAPQTGFGGLAR